MGSKEPHLRVHAVNIFVRDQERSLRFYLEQLGFRVAFDARPQSGGRWVAVAPPEGSTVLTLIAPRAESEEYKLIGRATQVVFVTDDVAAKFREWRERGVRFLHTPRLRRLKYGPARPAGQEPIWGGVFTRFEDVDGNSFRLVSFDEISQALEEQRRAAAEKLEAEHRAAQELEIARQVQSRLFPQTQPPLRTLDYAGICIQARQVGGDYYDFLNLGQERLGLIVGDIAGKGIAAALLMANLQANVRSHCAIALEQPQQLLRLVNQALFENSIDSAYATLFFAEYDDKMRRLRYANCGHLAGLLLHGDQSMERLDSTAPVVGLFKRWDCGIDERRLSPGDTLVLYTDGITEAFNERGEEFGEERLIEAARRCSAITAAEMVTAVLGEVQGFGGIEQSDDRTLIVARGVQR
jgi:serine phosphatase RsbU (regulator of sigma subunit)